MTMLVGVCCPEGVVLLTDSLVRQGGHAWLEHRPPVRMHWRHAAYLLSGTLPRGWRANEDLEPTTIRHLAERVYGQAEAVCGRQPSIGVHNVTGERQETPWGLDVLVGGLDDMGPQLVLMARETPLQHIVGAGVTVAGAASKSPVAARNWPLASTLQEAFELALEIAQEIVDDYYGGRKLDDFNAAGLIPPFAPPFSAVALNGVDVVEYGGLHRAEVLT